MKRPDLEAAYRATLYRVDTDGGSFNLRVSQPSTEVDCVLRRHETRTWAYITACNPGSEQLPAEENEARMAALREVVAEAGYLFWPGEGVDPSGAWPAEQSLLVLGISTEDARELARRFGQLAFVAGEVGEAARLVWVDPECDDC